jgi:signal transduction histidine kinase
MAEMNGNLTSCARPPLQLLERGGLARHLAGGLVASFRRQAGFKRQGFASGLALCLVVLACYVQAQTAQETLVTVAAVRDLTVAQAQRQPPVRLRGVVTFFDEALFSRFFQDGTAGIYLQPSANMPPLTPGLVVEIEGLANPGEYAPIIVPERVTVVGRGSLPAPKPVTYEQMVSGKEDSQFVEIAGIVRSTRRPAGSDYYLVEIATGGGRLTVYAKELPIQEAAELVDATVRVRGVCATRFNHQRQLFAIRLLVPRAEDLAIATPVPTDPFATPPRPLNSLLQFAPEDARGHRVKATGTVSYFEPGRRLYLQAGSQGIEVQTRERASLQPGDLVEALGFVCQGEYTPFLEDAVYRRTAAGPPLAAEPVEPEQALKGKHDCRLVQVAGRVLDQARKGAQRYLVLQDGDFIFHAYLPAGGEPNGFGHLANGSRVSVTGVCRIDPGEWQAGEDWRARGFRVELRSAADVAVLRTPPWWTLEKVLWMAGALALLSLAALGWVGVLRRQVAERTRELGIQIQQRQEAERQREVEQERARVAQDLHDDLGAGLTEISMLSSLVESPTTPAEEKERYRQELSATARRTVTSLDEIVWAVNPRNDTLASLASYFGAHAQRLLELASVACGLEVGDDLPDYPLEPKFRQELLLAFKEAITNVVRHAGATQVWLRIRVRDEALEVVVADNGRGLGVSAASPGADGLVNMRKRLRLLNGVCEIAAGPEGGTTVTLRAPLPKRLS